MRQFNSMTGEAYMAGGTNVDMNSDTMKTLLFDMTGEKYSVDRIRSDSPVIELLKDIAKMKDDGIYIIADVGGHFVNLTDLHYENRSGEFVIDYHDTSKNGANRTPYNLDDINGFYQVEREEQHKDRQEKEERVRNNPEVKRDGQGNTRGL